MAAKLALAMTQQQLRTEAGVHVELREFKTINTVATVDLCSTLNCDGFADRHTDAAHFDRSSFVGMAWRPPGAAVSVEAYSTGKMNIPGATSLRSCVNSFAYLLPKLVEFTSLDVPEHVRRRANEPHDFFADENTDCVSDASVPHLPSDDDGDVTDTCSNDSGYTEISGSDGMDTQ
tara:strand:- start:1305 stop:1832 length:528 start_codon:yes stop_codon:yes gene_type:complete